MKPETKNKIAIIIGASILAFGLYNIHAQTDVTEGGVLGLILFIDHFYKINPAISSYVIDISLFCLGVFVFGKSFLKNSLISTTTFSLVYYFSRLLGPQLPFITSSKLLSAICGALFVGVGTGLIIRSGGAGGGDDVIALIGSKYLKIKISLAYLITDISVLLLSLTYIPLENIIYSLITVIISSKIIDYIKNFKLRID